MTIPKRPSSQLTGEFRQCKLAECPIRFPVTLQARNKEFCCSEHRNRFHHQERTRAMAMLRQSQQGAKPGAGT